jgi:hypothetical protein
MASGINLYVGELEQMLQDMPVTVPPHGRLALQSGISTYRAQANWARQAMREFASEAERDAEK